MYNRYIRNDNGSYTRIPQEDPSQASSPRGGGQQQSRRAPPPPESEHKNGGGGQQPTGQHPGGQRPTDPPPPPPSGGPGHLTDGLTNFLRHILDQLHLDHVDTGDLLLLVLLFFLFREDADEELLVSLGLLLIL